MTAWTLAACREREAKYRATLAKIPGGVPTTTDEDRRALLALVERLLDHITEARARILTCDPRAIEPLNKAMLDAVLGEIDGGDPR